MNPLRYAAGFVANVASMRGVILRLAANDFRRRYLGSAFGAAWSVVPTLVTIAIFWFVFEVGVRYQMYHALALVPWNFFAEAVSRGSSAVMENAYMVRKVKFRAGILPITAILPAAAVHVAFVLALLAFVWAYGYGPSVYWLQIPYYMLATLALALGIAWACSAIVVFFQDLQQIIGLALQVAFWVTPIVWPRELMPASYTWLFKLNPVYYLVEGYRDALLNQRWFWDRHAESAVFWIVTLAVGVAGAAIFRRLRPQFADMLA